jgi:NTE family protein
MKLARAKKGKIGLALGSGAARGLAHIGVLKVLEKEEIPLDMIAGTSMGALIGALYAQEKNAKRIEELALEIDWKRLILLADPTLPKMGFVEGKKIKELLKSIIGDIKFSDLEIPFACVATDILTGEEVVIREGLVVEGVRASISLPVILTPAKWQGRFLVDGGLVNPVPVNLLKEMGADFTIAVNVIPEVGWQIYPQEGYMHSHYKSALPQGEDLALRNSVSLRSRLNNVEEKIKELIKDKGKTKRPKKSKDPNIFSVIMQTIHIIEYQIVKESLKGANVIIEPHLEHIGAGDFHQAKECILQGELATEKALPVELLKRPATNWRRLRPIGNGIRSILD